MRSARWGLALAGLVAVLLCSSCGPGKPATLSSDEGRFTVNVPGKYPQAKKQTQTVQTPIGPINFNMYVAEVRDSACFVGYNDYPEIVFTSQDLKTMLDGACQGAVTNINGQSEKQEDFTHAGQYPARRLYCHGTKDGKTAYVRAELIVVKPRLYQVMVMSYNKADLDQPETVAFFESFALKK